ncbi:DUF2970 domain-containing protein [Thalassotalea piscium]|uniref:DUF2970 domain-containing protein n=1 Tax=Thalassotalea piscium TaxID=1230533 RepID=A0A7X0NI13_9GAMM|nr:DUF2970 domain-containing protein [Thalassotalea piscium]MBB6543790.1 hypothetical protein [Thalassotalea piscium]
MNTLISISSTVKSVLYALLGVQSNENRKRDFTQGKLSHFIIVGVIAVIIFILILAFIVSMVVEV